MDRQKYNQEKNKHAVVSEEEEEEDSQEEGSEAEEEEGSQEEEEDEEESEQESEKGGHNRPGATKTPNTNSAVNSNPSSILNRITNPANFQQSKPSATNTNSAFNRAPTIAVNNTPINTGSNYNKNSAQNAMANRNATGGSSLSSGNSLSNANPALNRGPTISTGANNVANMNRNPTVNRPPNIATNNTPVPPMNQNASPSTQQANQEALKTPKRKDPKVGSLRYKFINQLIGGHSFIPTIKCSILFSLVVGALLSIIGIVVYYISNQVIEVSANYEPQCAVGQIQCNVTLTLSQTISGPVYFYLSVDNFYQNHRIYVKSYDVDQLKGSDVDGTTLASYCDPVTYNWEVSSNLKNIYSNSLVGTDVANPCGLIAASYINDDFAMYTIPSNASIAISTSGIAWSIDKERRFKRNANPAKQYRDLSSERFMNWMSFETSYNWKKLWGILNNGNDMAAGNYYFLVNNTYNTRTFGGEKYITLSNATILGGKSILLATLLLVMGGCYLALAILILIFKWSKKLSNNLNVDTINFDWN